MRIAIGLSVLAWASFLSPVQAQQPDSRGAPATEAAPAEEGRPAARASSGQLVTIEITIAEFTAEGRAAAPVNLDTVDLDTAENVAARLAELEGQGQVSVLTRAQLTTVDGSKAMLQIGERTSVATGQQFGFGGGRQRGEGGGGGQVSTTYTMENTGTMIQVRPFVEADGAVLVELMAEKSRIVPAAPRAAAEGEAPAFIPPRTSTLISQTTLRIPPGETVLVTGLSSSADAESGQAVILLSAKVADTPLAAAARREAAEAVPELRIYVLQNASAADTSEILSHVFDAERIRLGVDERTNSLLVQCSSELQEKVQAVVQRLDESE